MGASLLPLNQLDEAEIAAWRELAEAPAEPNPFFHPDFVLPVAQTIGSAGAGLLVVRDGGEWTACLPVRRRRGWHRLPFKGLVTWNHLYCFLGTPLIRPGAEEPVARRLLEQGHRRAGGFLGLDLLATDGVVGRALDSATAELGLRPVGLGRFSRATLRRRDDGRYLALSPKHRRNFERLRRRLEASEGSPLALQDRSDDPAARDLFLRIEASGWKGGEGTGTAFAAIGHRSLFERICERMAARGMLQLLAAETGGTTIAMLCNLISQDTAFTFKIAVSDSLSRYSPGVQLEILYLDHFHSLPGLQRADSCAEPGNEMINRLWPDRRELEIRAIPAALPRGLLVRSGLKGLARLRRRRS